MVRAGADFSGMRNEIRKAQQNLAEFKSSVNNTLKGIAVGLASIGIGVAIKEAAKDAIIFEASMQQIDRQMGESANTFKMWANESAAAFGMSRLEAVKYGAVYSNLLSTFSSGTAETAQRTQDLLKASAVVASSTGRTMEDTMERIRSGLLGNTESIEDLGINVNIAMIESTNAFKRFANGKSWEQLDFQTAQTVRYFAIMEQAAKKYGVEIADNTASRQASFVAQLKNAQLALGQAFLPIYNTILPALTRFATALANAMNFVARFSEALFGKANTNTTKATNQQAAAVGDLGDAYDSAGKSARGAVAGFDEINSLTDKAGSLGGGSGVTGAVTGEEKTLLSGVGDAMTEVSEKARAMAEKVKEAFRTMKEFIVENKDVIIAALATLAAAFAGFWVATKWASVVAAFQTAGRTIAAAIAGISLPITLIIAAVAALVGAFVYFYRTNESFRGVVDGILQKIGDVALWLWQNVMVPFGQFLKTTMVAAWDGVSAAVSWLWDNVMKPFGTWLAGAFVEAWDGVSTAAKWLWKNVLVPLGEFLGWLNEEILEPLAKVLTDILGVAFSGVAEIAKSFWKDVIVPLSSALSELFKPAVEAVTAVLKFLWENTFVPFGNFIKTTIMPIIQGLIDIFMWLWENALKPLTNFVKDTVVTVFSEAFATIKAVIEDVKTAFNGLMNFITGVFTGDWQRAWDGIKDIFGGVWGAIEDIVRGVMNIIIGIVNTFINFWNGISLSVPEVDIPLYGKVGGYTISVPKIQNIPKIELRRGGIVSTTTDMGNYVAGEAGTEMIVPLENTSFVDAVASALGTAVMTAMQMGGQGANSNGGDVVINIDGTTFARIVKPYLDREQQRVGSNAIIQPI
jgi:phage-related protein